MIWYNPLRALNSPKYNSYTPCVPMLLLNPPPPPQIFPHNGQVSGRGELKINLVWCRVALLVLNLPLFSYLLFTGCDFLSLNMDIFGPPK